jgi:hypothetical protein
MYASTPCVSNSVIPATTQLLANPAQTDVEATGTLVPQNGVSDSAPMLHPKKHAPSGNRIALPEKAATQSRAAMLVFRSHKTYLKAPPVSRSVTVHQVWYATNHGTNVYHPAVFRK